VLLTRCGSIYTTRMRQCVLVAGQHGAGGLPASRACQLSPVLGRRPFVRGLLPAARTAGRTPAARAPAPVLAPARCRRRSQAAVCAAASTAAWPGKYDGEDRAARQASDQPRGATVLPRPASLPEPPASSRLLDVMPYLVKLATSDRQLWWRLGGAVLLMFVSKAAGEPTLGGAGVS